MSKSNISVGTKGWADKINEAWRRSVEDVINIGHVLLQAKEVTPHGDFENMIKTQLVFSLGTARKLMAVARDSRVTRYRALGAIPDHWTTLYELTKLSDDEFDQALKDGTIRADMERRDVPKKRKETPQGAAVLAESGTVPVDRDAISPTPHGVREGEESGVTIEHASGPDDGDKTVMAARSEASGESEHSVSDPPLYPAESSHARGTGPDAPLGNTAPARETAADGRVGFWVDVSDPISRFANGLALAMAASRELTPAAASMAYPEGMPLLTSELAQFTAWILDFEDAFREGYGAGNDAGIGL